MISCKTTTEDLRQKSPVASSDEPFQDCTRSSNQKVPNS